MDTVASSAIWGRASVSGHGLAAPRSDRLSTSGLIERQLATFLRDEIAAWSPELIIVVERKGTAIFRALIEGQLITWRWSDVISSNVINQVRPERLRDRRILVFDDLMHRGGHLVHVLQDLEKRGVNVSSRDHLRTAVFAVHADGSCGTSYGGRTIPDSWFLRNLTTRAQRAVRTRVVEFLQRSGSLMLDTEHIEIRVRIRESFIAFQEALGRRAEAVQFHSLAHRPNVTVYYGDHEPHLLPQASFPEGSVLTNIVKKCRIVQRAAGEFAVIPICYPGIPVSVSEAWPSEPRDVELLGQVSELGGVSRIDAMFYAAALLAALHVLTWVVKDLSAAGAEVYPLSLPGMERGVPLGASSTGFTLEHLHAMYPNLNTAALYERIASDVQSSQSVGGQIRNRQFDAQPPLRVADAELRENALALIQLIRHTLDKRAVLRCLTDDCERRHPCGLTAAEIFDLGRRHQWEAARISALFDILIDDAHLVTHVEERLWDNRSVAMRTFEPDGEIVSDLIRQLTTQWGLPRE